MIRTCNMLRSRRRSLKRWMIELRAREKQSMALCEQYKCIAERERGKVEVMVKEAK